MTPNQRPLFDFADATERDRTITEAFREFHAENPGVYDDLVRLAREAVRRGRRRIGMKALFEILRWEREGKPWIGKDEFRLNNNFTSRYARLIAHCEPDLADLFEMRRLKSEAKEAA